jgi:hypothetical protein
MYLSRSDAIVTSDGHQKWSATAQRAPANAQRRENFPGPLFLSLRYHIPFQLKFDNTNSLSTTKLPVRLFPASVQSQVHHCARRRRRSISRYINKLPSQQSRVAAPHYIMVSRSRLPLADPLLEDESDRLVIASESALLRHMSRSSKRDAEYKKLRNETKKLGREQDDMEEDLVNAYHGADSKATRLDGQNKRLIAQLELAEHEGDELKAHNNDLIRCLAESKREVARLKAAEKDKETAGTKRKREDVSSEIGPDTDESAFKTEERPQAKFLENLCLGMPKPQGEKVAVKQEEEEPPQKRPRKRPHRGDTRYVVLLDVVALN